MKGVADTLFIPLNARIYVSKRFPEFFYDAKALELEKDLPDSEILENSSEYSFLASVSRYCNMDKMVKNFIEKNDRCNIVYLGAGLETAYYRLNNSKAVFYEVDLPDVIETRKEILGENNNEILIGGDMFDLKWIEKIDTSLPTMLLSSGVFMYFKEDKIIGLIQNIQKSFVKSELVFDATDEFGINYANRYVKKTGNKDAMMYFYIEDSNEFVSKFNDVSLLADIPFYTDARKMLKGKLKIITRIFMKVADNKKRTRIIHLNLG